MLPHVLLVQFRTSTETARLELESVGRELGTTVVVRTASALDGELTWNNPRVLLDGVSGVILGGSGDFDFDGCRDVADPARIQSYELLDQLRPLLDYIFEHDVPTLGICFGHQLIGAYKGVTVHHDPTQSKMKSHQVELLVDTVDHSLLQDLPRSFSAQYGHKDVLATVPVDARLVMCGGDCCQISALAYQKNIYTVQFHPELSVADMYKRVETTPGYLPEGCTVEALFEDSPAANRLLHNFASLVISQSDQY
ncbi:MAG: hypothetical protein RLZZ70_438 [Candidatus Parcubacteria bacterium]|jgi:GMP synthase-like glutamine amidotransferase